MISSEIIHVVDGLISVALVDKKMKVSGRGKRRKNKLPHVALLVSPPAATAFLGPIREKEI